jgi:methionyl-tRNA formyltransferase
MSLKIIFMGTPEFAIPPIKKILQSDHKILAVVTAPDKERGRGRKVSFTAVKEFALQNNLPLLQPENLKDPSFAEALKEYDADIYVVVAFRILPKEIFNIPRLGAFNLHASLLPKYRGAAPIQWAIIKGEKETGVTTFKLEEKVDTGNVYLMIQTEIGEEDNLESVSRKLSEIGAEAVIKTLDLIESGAYNLLPQDNSLATPAPKINKETGKIDWEKRAEEVYNLIRGLNPHPGAYFSYLDKVIKIYRSKVIKDLNLGPGEIKATKNQIFIGCGRDALEVLELQQEGKKVLSSEEFLRGFRFS